MSTRRAKSGPRLERLSSARRDGSRTRSAKRVPAPTMDYRRFFEHSPDAILIVDADGRYLAANPAACTLTGYTVEELLRMRVGDLAIPADREESAQRLELLRTTGQSRRDRSLLRKDGSTVRVEAHAAGLGDGTFQIILRDVSTRAAAEAELHRSLDAYSTLVGLCHAAVISAGPDGRVRSWNPAAETLLGYKTSEAIGLAIVDLVPERLRDQHREGFQRHVRSPAAEPFGRTLNTEALCKDGREVPVEVSVAVGRQGNDQVFTAVVRDMTERRLVMEKLNDALQRLQFHVERMPLAYIVWDTDFRVVEWNPAAEHTFGYSKAEAMGRHAYDLVVPEDAQPAVDRVWEDLLKGNTSSHSINANVRKDGSRLTCEWVNTPLCDVAGRIHGVASMARDVSEREALESRIRDAQKLESLGVLAGGIAHDFNSSLMVILGNTALLRATKGLPPRAMEHMELIEEAGLRADQLIKHLLAYARTGRHKSQPTDINVVIRDSRTFIRSSLGKRHELELHCADPLDAILADRSQVEQILLNLCLNAKQSMPKGGKITVTTRRTTLAPAQAARCVPYNVRPGDYVEMMVTDSGSGMDAATVSRIFDPFFTTKPDGHGLGMTAVLGILRQHNAAALVESQLQKGTKIHIYFPIPTK